MIIGCLLNDISFHLAMGRVLLIVLVELWRDWEQKLISWGYAMIKSKSQDYYSTSAKKI
jgi:hypothetical protein